MPKHNKRGTPDTNFANVTFDEIKEKLVNRMKVYYPDTYRDFNKTSFGSLMVDMMAMIGEQLNFYAQFVANESYLETMRTIEGYTAAARKNGLELCNKYTSVGYVNVITRVPANALLTGPDTNYSHTILRGSVFTTDSGAQFTSTRDVTVDLNVEKIIGSEFTETDDRVTYYLYESSVPVVSGEERVTSVDIESYRKFLKVEVRDDSVSEILKVVDSNGNEYYEVPSLSHGFIFKEITERRSNPNSSESVSRLVKFPVPRRFEARCEGDRTFLMFGFGSEDDLQVSPVAEPHELELQSPGNLHFSDFVFDPVNILANNGNYGISPQNTTLTITYRSNTSENSNAAANTINNISSVELLFEDESLLDTSKIAHIRSALSCTNEEPINGSLKYSSTREVVESIQAAAGAQGRAVTIHDYVSLCYTMPSQLGSVYRASVIKDEDDLNRNLNIYIISQDEEGFLQQPSLRLKENLKMFLNEKRSASDTVDIYSATIVNFGIFFDVVLNDNTNKTTALSEIRRDLFDQIKLSPPEIGQYFSIGEIEKQINKMPIVSRVNSVRISTKISPDHANTRFDVQSKISQDGGLIMIPDNFIFEIKYPTDITGRIQ